ncbi:MAG: hypothetical protein BIFFINMI_01201 [Phycisphaerae bacterium]|nr:hypothetical protein [Phycisphaerae bacterium]
MPDDAIRRRGWLLPAAAAWLAVLAAAPRAAQAGRMVQYTSKYYTIYTDLENKDDIREAVIRMTAMAEEYAKRTRNFGGAIRERLPFYLYSDEKDYRAAGGPAGSWGVFISDRAGSRLMAIAGERTTNSTWRLVQHEGFHQYAFHVIRGRIPPWANEGLAEYFAEGLFTGDGFVVGAVSPQRLAALKVLIKAGKTRRLEDVMKLTPEEWSQQVAAGEAELNYLQSWSVVHFLVHADNGKYCAAFEGLIKDISAGRDWKISFRKQFHTGSLDALEAAWKRYWLELPLNASDDLYAEATVATMASYWARALAAGQKFETSEEFFKAAEAGELKITMKDWLPLSLLKLRLPLAQKLGAWRIEDAGKSTPKLLCDWQPRGGEGALFVGTFRLRGGLVDKVRVDRRDRPTTQPDGD